VEPEVPADRGDPPCGPGSALSASDTLKDRNTAIDSRRFPRISSSSPRRRSKPRIYGPQTALVVGPSGEEIYIDKWGASKVQFFWDKQNPKEIDRGQHLGARGAELGWKWMGNLLLAARQRRSRGSVSQWDPDNPVITGSVYNGVNTPKYALPDNSTRSGIVTRSSKGGSAANANELRFEDKMGSEQIFLHAEKDMDVSIEHDRAHLVGEQRLADCDGNQTEQIG
jgi:type VI secretion system secreted protein VgrG